MYVILSIVSIFERSKNSQKKPEYKYDYSYPHDESESIKTRKKSRKYIPKKFLKNNIWWEKERNDNTHQNNKSIKSF